MKRAVTIFVILLLFACLPQGFRLKNAPASNLVQAQTTGQSITSIIASILKALYQVCGYFNVVFAAAVNFFVGCYTSIAVTAPEFTSGFLAGLMFPALSGYILCALLHPLGWITLLLTFILGFPIPLPFELVCAVLGLIPGFFLGLLLGTMNLLNRPTPGEIILSSIEQ